MSTRPSEFVLPASDSSVVWGETLMEIAATSTGARFVEPLSAVEPSVSNGQAVFIDQCVRMDDVAAMADNDNFAGVNMRRLQTYQVAVGPIGKQDATR